MLGSDQSGDSQKDRPCKRRGKFSFTYTDGGFKLAIEGKVTTQLVRIALTALTTTGGFFLGASTFPQEARSDYKPPVQIEQRQPNEQSAPTSVKPEEEVQPQ